MSVIGRGSYGFCASYKHLEVNQLQWMHMTKETDIVNIPLETLKCIWHKASELLRTQGAVVAGPRLTNSDPRTIIVPSNHTVAAAQFGSELREFLRGYCKKKCSPSLTQLSKSGTSKGVGKKGDKPPRKPASAETIYASPASPTVPPMIPGPPSFSQYQNIYPMSQHQYG
uniref:Uncharacterized protein n=1 Tax=Amphimedon queenslandica TaxID=400682 RepID=A0A1X7VKK5_AMPQE